VLSADAFSLFEENGILMRNRVPLLNLMCWSKVDLRSRWICLLLSEGESRRLMRY